jgi:hypothetical protein
MAVLARHHDADDCNSRSDQHRRQRPPELSDSMVTLDQNFERPKSNVSKKRPQLGEAEAVVICCARQPRGGVDANAAQYTQHMPVSDDDLY